MATARTRRSNLRILRWLALLAAVPVLGAAAFLLGALDWHANATDPTAEAAAFSPGSPWDGQGASGISEADARQFDTYPLLWLGPTFGGYHLQSIVRQEVAAPAGAPAHNAANSVTLIYGQCTIPPNASACTGPLTLHVEPGCMARPEWTAAFGTTTTTRGDALQRTFPDGHIRLWTGPISISLNAIGNPDLTRTATQQLAGLNTLASSITPSSPLASPDLSTCPPVETPPINATATMS